MIINDIKGRAGRLVINTIRSWLTVFTFSQCTCVTIHCPNMALVFITIYCGYEFHTKWPAPFKPHTHNVWRYREDEIVRPTPQQWSTKQNHISHTHLDLGSQPSLSRSQQIIFCWTKSFTQQWVQEVTNRLRFDLWQTEEMKKQQFLLTIAFHYQSVHKDKVICPMVPNSVPCIV